MSHYHIIGGGPLGLSLAFELMQAGKTVSIIDEGDVLGGLARYQEFDSMLIDRYYHFYYWKDHFEADKFLQDTQSSCALVWRKIKSTTYVNSRFFNFDGLPALFALSQRKILRVLLTLVKLKVFNVDPDLDRISAVDWATNKFGKKFANAIWIPLLQDKFGAKFGEVSAYWLATRIKRHLSTKVGFPPLCKFGYLTDTYKKSFQAVLDRIVESGGRIYSGNRVVDLNVSNNHITSIKLRSGEQISVSSEDKVVSTVPLAAVQKIFLKLPNELSYLTKFESVGVILVTLSLGVQLSDSYWTTVTDLSLPFKVIIQQNRLSPRGPSELVYLSKYYYEPNGQYEKSDEEILNSFWLGLKKMYPHLEDKHLRAHSITRSSYAAPIPTMGMLDLLPSFKTPISNFYHGGYEHIYPEDRGVGNSLRVGRQLAEYVINREGI